MTLQRFCVSMYFLGRAISRGVICSPSERSKAKENICSVNRVIIASNAFVETQTKTVAKNKKVDKFKEDSQLFYLNSSHRNRVIASTIISRQRREKWKKKIVARVPRSMLSSRACRHFVCACMYRCVRRMTYERS